MFKFVGEKIATEGQKHGQRFGIFATAAPILENIPNLRAQ